MAGISEPALYGVAIRLKRPLIAESYPAVLSAVLLLEWPGLQSHSMAAPGPVHQRPVFDPANPMTIVWVFGVMALAVVLSFVLTLILGFEDIPVEDAAAQARKTGPHNRAISMEPAFDWYELRLIMSVFRKDFYEVRITPTSLGIPYGKGLTYRRYDPHGNNRMPVKLGQKALYAADDEFYPSHQAIDFTHRYKEDIALMAEMGFTVSYFHCTEPPLP